MKISIQEPCHESWDKMKRDGDKKFCASCTKYVHDFTSYSDEMLIDFFKRNGNKNSCGRFRKNQLDRKIFFQKRIRSRFNYFWVTIISVFAFVKNSYSQNTTIRNECGIEMKVEVNKKKEIQTGKIFAGLVMESRTNNSVADCKIMIEGIDSVFSSNKAGMFEIVLPESFNQKKCVVKFEAEHFFSDSLEIEFEKYKQYDLLLELGRKKTDSVCKEEFMGRLAYSSYTEKEYTWSNAFTNMRRTSFNTVKEFLKMLGEWSY